MERKTFFHSLHRRASSSRIEHFSFHPAAKNAPLIAKIRNAKDFTVWPGKGRLPFCRVAKIIANSGKTVKMQDDSGRFLPRHGEMSAIRVKVLFQSLLVTAMVVAVSERAAMASLMIAVSSASSSSPAESQRPPSAPPAENDHLQHSPLYDSGNFGGSSARSTSLASVPPAIITVDLLPVRPSGTGPLWNVPRRFIPAPPCFELLRPPRSL
jgi:hypothetical protein